MAESFYIFLPSNVKSKGTINTQSNYTTILPVTKQLNGKWECALVQMIYPRTWNNVLTGPDPKHPIFQQNQVKVRKAGGIYENFFVNPGNYSSITKLIAYINLKLKGTTISFKYNDITKNVTATYDTKVLDYFMLSGQLRFILGFQDETQGIIYMKKLQNNVAKYPASLDANFNSLYVYSNIVEPSIVGDSMVPLLRICNVEGKYGDIITKTFSNPHYVPVRLNTLNSIEISVKDDLNQNIPFVYGTIVVKLHFRKINPLF